MASSTSRYIILTKTNDEEEEDGDDILAAARTVNPSTEPWNNTRERRIHRKDIIISLDQRGGCPCGCVPVGRYGVVS